MMMEWWSFESRLTILALPLRGNLWGIASQHMALLTIHPSSMGLLLYVKLFENPPNVVSDHETVKLAISQRSQRSHHSKYEMEHLQFSSLQSELLPNSRGPER